MPAAFCAIWNVPARCASAPFSPTMARSSPTVSLACVNVRPPAGRHEFDRLCSDLGLEHRLAPPQHPQTNGIVERFNGRIEEVLQSHHFRSGEELETTLNRYVLLYNQQLPQSALGTKTPLQVMKDWHKLKPELFRKQPCQLPGCDTYHGTKQSN